MFKIQILVVSLLAFMMIAEGQITLFNSGGQSMTIQYVQPLPGKAVAAALSQTLNSNMQMLQASTAICISTDSSYTIASGSAAFAFQSYCLLPTCSVNTQLGQMLYSSVISSINPVVWAGQGISLGNLYSSVYTYGSGQNPSFLYEFTQGQFSESGLPAQGVASFYVCCYLYNANYAQVFLGGNINIYNTFQCSNVAISG